MAEEIIIDHSKGKADVYQQIFPQLRALLEGEDDMIANMANTSAVLKDALGFFWVGFYILKNNELVLGPFQGPVACTRIKIGKGVCGVSAESKESIIVPNVEEFPGHIACSAESKSEIVIPKLVEGEVQWVFDVDSNKLNDFDEVDKTYLEKIVGLL